MFSAEDILKRLKGKPFQPFRIIASEELTYDILHPDLVLVGRRDLTIGFADSASPLIYDQQIRVALVHIVGMLDLPAASPTSTNGQS